MALQLAQPNQDEKEVCKYCRLQYPATEGRWHREAFECRHCAASLKALYRNLGELPEDFKQLSSEETTKFFADLAQQRTELAKDKSCSWTTVRASLVTTLAEKRTTTFKQELEGKFLPLSVWEKQGFDTDKVKNCPKEENEVLGDLYCVPIKTISWSETVEKVRQTLLDQERQATAKKQAKGKNKTAEDLDLPAPASASKEEKPQDFAKQNKRTYQQNAKLNALAAKSLGSLTTQQSSLEKLLAKFVGDKHGCMQTAEQGQQELQPLSLPYDAAELKVLLQQVLVVRDIRAGLAKGKRKPDEAGLLQSSGSRTSAGRDMVECDSPGLDDEGLGFFLDTEPSKPRPLFFDKTDSPQPVACRGQKLTTKQHKYKVRTNVLLDSCRSIQHRLSVELEQKMRDHVQVLEKVQQFILAFETGSEPVFIYTIKTLKNITCDAASCLEFANQCRQILSVVREDGKGSRTASMLMLADHEGMRALSGWKGSSGYRPCFKCANVVSLGGARPASFVDIANSDITRLRPLSHADLCEIRQKLDSLSSTTTKLQEAEKLLGWKLEELSKSFLASPALSGWAELEDCAVDAMHAYWSNGVVAQELGLWYTALLDNSDVNLGHVHAYVKAGWTACPAAGTAMPQVCGYFSEHLWKKGHDFRGDARMCLVALPLCVRFGEEILRGNVLSLDAVLDSLLALNRVCICILRSKADVSHSTNLLGLQADHMRRFDLAHGRQHRPKMHFGLHIREQCARWHRLVDCFACERKHRAFKQVASNVRNLTQFNKSCLLELATGDIHADVHSSDATLQGATVDCPDLAAVLSCSTSPKLAKTACSHGLTAKSEDYFVLSPELAVLVWGALAVSAQSKTLQPGSFLLVEPLIAASINRNAREDGCTEWHPSDKPLALLDIANLSRVHQVSFARKTRNADGQVVVSLLH
ncbi:unnamed protein product [Symbiodinium sp. CCMP2592]|nr:unnamed protein product [Symbiodinium sp. CCMP2592]